MVVVVEVLQRCCAVGTVSWCYYATARNNPGRASLPASQQSHHVRYHTLEQSGNQQSHQLYYYNRYLPIITISNIYIYSEVRELNKIYRTLREKNPQINSFRRTFYNLPFVKLRFKLNILSDSSGIETDLADF